MTEDKLFVSDLAKEVAIQALSMDKCDPFLELAMENARRILEHDASAILLTNSEPRIYLRFNRSLSESFKADFISRSVESFNSSFGQKLSKNDFINLSCIPEQNDGQGQDEGQKILSYYYTPLNFRDELLGIFAIASVKPDVFLVYRLNMFKVFVSQVALAIDSLHAREKVIRQARVIERDSANMKNVLRGMSEGLILADENDKIILMNPVAQKILGIQEGRKQEPADEEFLLAVFPAMLKKLYLSNDEFIKRQIEINRPKRMTLGVEASAAKGAGGEKLGTVVILKDITAEKEIERLKSEFVSTVSHELRTPLTTIRESVSQVLDGILGDTTAEQRQFLGMCLEDIDRLSRIINDLLDISKIEAKKFKIFPENIDIVEIVKGVKDAFASIIKEKGLELRLNFSAEKVEAEADKDKLIQVFTNLIGNSIKFTDKGFIEVSVAQKGDEVECSVFDTGRGISEEDLSKTFSKFQQFGRTDGPGEKGTGLGLSIAKGIVELHKGRIWVESRFGEWTKFTFIFPKKASETEAAADSDTE